jgi:hypothetical protein
MTTTDQKLPEGFHWHVEGGRALPAPDPDCGLAPFDVACTGPRPPLALPCPGGKVLTFPQGERRGS